MSNITDTTIEERAGNLWADLTRSQVITIISEALQAERDRALSPIKAMVDAQAEDEGLWFEARTAPEGYLQIELRNLHSIIETALKGDSNE